MQIVIVECLWCGKRLFEEADLRQPRSDKKFCSAVCRGKYHRWQNAIEKHEARAKNAVGALAEYLQHPQAKPQAAQALVRVREKIKDEFGWAGIKAVR